MLVVVGVPLTVGALKTAPSPLTTALAVTVPVGAIGEVAPVTLTAGMLVGNVIVLVDALNVSGIPVMLTVTTVLLVRIAVPTLSPGGKFETASVKLASTMVPVAA